MTTESFEAPRAAETPPRKRKRGFGGMAETKAREIASLGGKAAHALGKAHKFSSEEARIAGRRGGATTSADRKHMAEIGRLGGLVKAKKHAVPALGAAHKVSPQEAPIARPARKGRKMHEHDGSDGWPADRYEFGEAVQVAREECGVSRELLAVLANIAPHSLRSIEAGRYNTSPPNRNRLIVALARLRSHRERRIAEHRLRVGMVFVRGDGSWGVRLDKVPSEPK